MFTHNKSVTEVSGKTVIKDIVIVQSGVDKVGDLLDNTFIEGIVSQGNQFETGVKCRAGHPNMCKDSLGTYLGDYYNFRAVEDNGQFKAIADLHLSDITKKTQIDGKGISYHDYLVEMSTNHPDKLGNSIVFTASSSETVEIEGKSVNKLLLDSFIASDIVDSPAATDGLFKGVDDLGLRLTEFLDENPEIFESIEKNENAIDIFFKKYTKHLFNNQTKIMKLSERIKSLLGVHISKNIDITDASGTIITVITDANEPQPGDKVEIGGQPAPDGEYTFPDGSVWSVMGGVIETITTSTPADQTQPVQASEEPVVEPVVSETEKSIETLKSEINDLKELVSKLVEDKQELEKSVIDLAKHIKSEYVPGQEVEKPRRTQTEEPTTLKRTPLK